jgi:hypothetical protein
MSPQPDPQLLPDQPPLGPDRRLWWGLALGGAAIALLVLAVHWLVPAPPPAPHTGKAPLNDNPPLMSQPQRLETQQAMPELRDFDSANPPPNPTNSGGPLGSSAPPSALGTGALGQ